MNLIGLHIGLSVNLGAGLRGLERATAHLLEYVKELGHSKLDIFIKGNILQSVFDLVLIGPV